MEVERAVMACRTEEGDRLLIGRGEAHGRENSRSTSSLGLPPPLLPTAAGLSRRPPPCPRCRAAPTSHRPAGLERNSKPCAMVRPLPLPLLPPRSPVWL